MLKVTHDWSFPTVHSSTQQPHPHSLGFKVHDLAGEGSEDDSCCLVGQPHLRLDEGLDLQAPSPEGGVHREEDWVSKGACIVVMDEDRVHHVLRGCAVLGPITE